MSEELHHVSDDGEDLYACASTYKCAIQQFCIPCFYKLFPSGEVTSSVRLPANIRPELCSRSSGANTSLKFYSSKAKLLTVGDGDLSFSRSLSSQGYADKLTATTHESLDSIMRTYPNADEILSILRTQGVSLYHEVDATRFEDHKVLRNDSFDIVIWNFPCIRVAKGADGQVSELEQNRTLLRTFFQSVKQILRKGGEVHIAHKTIEPFSWWGLCQIAEEESFHLYRKIAFDRCNFPGYTNRKVLDRKSFPCHDARLYVFTLDNADIHKSKLSKKVEFINMTDLLIQEEILAALNNLSSTVSKPRNKPVNKPMQSISGEKRTACNAFPSDHHTPQADTKESMVNKKIRFDT